MGSNEPIREEGHVDGYGSWGSPSARAYDTTNLSYPTRSLDFLDQRYSITASSNNGTSCVKLSIVVVGAGLGGLATAIALALKGHKVMVLEQATKLSEVGAGIQVPSNSTRILQSLGLGSYLRDHVVEPEGITFRRWQDGSKIAYTKLVPDFTEKYGAPFYVVHRAHLHQALVDRALDLGVEIKTNHHVSSYSEVGATVSVDGVGELVADFVVAADGIMSVARRQISGQPDAGPIETGFAAYRATVDVAKMQSDPDVSWLLESPAQNIWIGEGRHVMTYSISSGKFFNMVLSHTDHSDPSTWPQRNALNDMRKEFADWDPRLVKLISLVTSTAKWPLRTSRPQGAWLSPQSQRLLVIGDASHAMLPYMSQGAAMAVEDGVALAAALDFVRRPAAHSAPLGSSTTTSGEDVLAETNVEDVLAIYERVRRHRTSQMQQASMVNGKLWHYADGPEQRARDAATQAEVEGRAFVKSANQWSDPVTQAWAYGYDAVEEMVTALVAGGLGSG